MDEVLEIVNVVDREMKREKKSQYRKGVFWL
jgi:hypothetical protein